MWLQAVQLNGSAPSRGSPYPISKCLLHPRFLSSLSPPPPKQMTRQKKTCGYIYLLPRTPRTLPQSYQLVCLGGPVPSPPCTHGSQVTPTLGPNQGNIAKAGLAGSHCQCQGVYPTFPLKILSVFSHMLPRPQGWAGVIYASHLKNFSVPLPPAESDAPVSSSGANRRKGEWGPTMLSFMMSNAELETSPTKPLVLAV